MNEVREKRGMAYSVYSYFMPLQQPGAFQIGLQTKKEQVGEALRVVRETLQSFVRQGVTEKELLAAKQNIIYGFPLRIDSNGKILDYLSLIGFYNLPVEQRLAHPVGRGAQAVAIREVQDAAAVRAADDAYFVNNECP